MTPRALPTDPELDAFRHLGDPLADAVVDEFARRRLRGDPVEMLETLARDDFEAAVHMLDHVLTVPTWVDFELMQPAFAVALQNVVASGMALMAGSLIASYASSRGAKVLVRTGRLEDDTLRRLFETGKFVSDLAILGGAQPRNVAWRNVVAVRLMHAWVRRRLRDRPDWNHAAWGLPINQEDYAATLFMFSIVYRGALEILGVPMTPAEHAGGQMNWRWVGWLMGVDPRLIPVDCEDERLRFEQMRERNFDPDDDSRALSNALLNAMSGRAPFFLPRRALHVFSRRLIGDELADQLGFERSRRWLAVVEAGRWMNVVGARIGRETDPLSVWFGRRLSTRIVALAIPDGTRFSAQ